MNVSRLIELLEEMPPHYPVSMRLEVMSDATGQTWEPGGTVERVGIEQDGSTHRVVIR